MDKLTYLENKKKQAAQMVNFERENYCYQCIRLKRNCLCALIHPFKTAVHFVILMHPKEAHKEKIGTGRLTKLSLINSQMITGVDFSDDPKVNALIADDKNVCWLLYPGKKALNISEGQVEPLKNEMDQGKRLVLFILDGTWPCSKKMLRLSGNLRRLPRISFTSELKSNFLIKHQPAQFCLSTLESIHTFIKECNRVGLEDTSKQEDQLLEVFKVMIQYQIDCSLDPSRGSRRNRRLGYSRCEDRSVSKKWSKRNIVLMAEG